MMDWDGWKNFLEKLVGLSSGGRKVYLLVPRPGRSELSQTKGQELGQVAYEYLFSGHLLAQHRLRELAGKPVQESLPLLYLSRWIAYEQEDAHAFWPPFRSAVIRNKLSDQTVQQQVAPLITALWTKAHRELGIYRPQEGYVHIKWPQAHAGLTKEEKELIADLVVANAGRTEEPPDELYVEPYEFLGLLRTWLHSQAHVSKRLSRLVFGPDGPALMVAELSQKLLLELWPPSQIPAMAPAARKLPPPYVRLSLDPLHLSIVLPDGNLPGYTMLEASYADNRVQLETSYSERLECNVQTFYKSHEWPVTHLPWASEVILQGTESLPHMKVIPACPIRRGRFGTIMFDPISGRWVSGWRPNRHYLLLISTPDIPNLIHKLFTDIEVVDSGRIDSLDMMALSAVGRNIGKEFDRELAFDFLADTEEEIDKAGALITLPDYGELVQPEINFMGGLPVAEGQYPTYLTGHGPLVGVQNIPQGGLEISIHRRQDDGREVMARSTSLKAASTEPVVLDLTTLETGSYVIRGLSKPKYFKLVPQVTCPRSNSMHVSLRLLHAEQVISPDDIRHFQFEGIEVKSWPSARVMLKVQTEAGSESFPIRVDEDGGQIVRACEINLPATTKWAKVEGTAWLARSEPMDLTLRPYVAPNDWCIRDGKVIAHVRGVQEGTGFVLAVLPHKPWNSSIQELAGVVGPDSEVQVDLMAEEPSNGWILLSDAIEETVWLLSHIGEGDGNYNGGDFSLAYRVNLNLPSYVNVCARSNQKLLEMCCLVWIAELAREALIPLEDDPLPDNIVKFLKSLEPTVFSMVRLPYRWGNKRARVESSDHPSGRAFLVVDGQRFLVYVTSLGSKTKATWGEESGPCICMACHKVMTQRLLYSHRCKYHGSFQILDREFIVEPIIDWAATMEIIERVIVEAIAHQLDKGPKGLESLWAPLQKSFRNRQVEEAISPDAWVKKVFSLWRELFDLVNGKTSQKDWISLWESTAPYRYALMNLMSGKAV